MDNKIISLSNGTLKINISTFGAEIQSVKGKNGTEFMWEGNPDVWSGKAPVLFPICGGLKEDTYTFEGKKYTLEKHGYARRIPYEIEEQTESKAVLLAKSNDETKKKYPFDYEFRVIFELTENKLKVTYNVKNTGCGSMYFSVGAHEAYACPEGIESYTVEFEKNEDFHCYKLDGNILLNSYNKILPDGKELPLKEDYFDVDALVFKTVKSRKVSLKKNGATKRIDVEFPNSNYFLLWNKYRAKYMCLEPWCGIQDIENTSYDITEKEGIIKLDKNSDFSASHTITFTE